jgi:hypothetical protein
MLVSTPQKEVKMKYASLKKIKVKYIFFIVKYKQVSIISWNEKYRYQNS